MKTSKDPRHLNRIQAMQELFAWNFTDKNELRSKTASLVAEHLTEIDKQIQAAAPTWPIEKINKVDLAILRLAVFELLIERTAPTKVVIDEAVELAKEWRMDRMLSRLEAMMIVADKDDILIISGTGDVIEPDMEIATIGSGSMFAQSAARAMKKFAPNLTAEEMVRESLHIAADVCIYTNHNLVIEKVKA